MKKLLLVVLLIFGLTCPSFAANPSFVAFYSNDGTGGGGGNATVPSVVLAAGTNRRIIVGIAAEVAVTTVASGISGATGATFTKVGSTGAGNGSALAEMWCQTGTLSSETVTITAALQAATENHWGMFVWVYDNVDATTPCETFAAVTGVSTSTAVTAGNAAVSFQIDSNNNRTLADPPVSCTGTEDVSTYAATGRDAAHCDNQASPNVFNWGTNTNVIAGGSIRASGGGAAVVPMGTLTGILP